MSNELSKEMILCENLVKIYKTKDIEVVALQGLDLTVERGEMMAIIGNSGSGKSTLLNMLGGLDRPSAGRLMIDGKDLLKYSDAALVDYRLNTVGFVWQNNARNLIPYLTAQENVELPMIISGVKNRKERALQILEMTGLSKRRNSKLNQLSGGEQQRVAISIAMANNPKLLLADEPTGSVDNRTADMIMGIFRELSTNFGITVVIVTHDRQLSRKVDRVVAIRDGRTSSEFLRKEFYSQQLSEVKSISTEETHVELAVVDKSGRMQIPHEYLEKLGMRGKNKLRVELEGDRIVLFNPEKKESGSI